MQFTLFGTSACHLCDIAEQMLQLQQRLHPSLHQSLHPSLQLQAGTAFDFDKVDISESDTLFERYGVLIPVLQHPDGRELNWPFSREQLERFLAS
jgi:hypothetical protein